LKKRPVSGLMLILLTLGMLMSAFNIQPVKAQGTIYIRADGSVDPSSAPINRDGNVYTFTDNIVNNSIVVERNNIVLDGAGHTVEGTGNGIGIDLSGRSNVTVKNMKIIAFDLGIYLSGSSANMIQGNNITDTDYGIIIATSSNNVVIGNSLTDHNCTVELDNSAGNSIIANNIKGGSYGPTISMYSSDYNTIFRNTIRGPLYGIYVSYCSNNNLTQNDVRDNYEGIRFDSSQDNFVYNNNFVNNTVQVSLAESVDFWNMDYPVCGNYWSNYNGTDLYSGAYQNETGSDGIGDTGYIISTENVDHYPLTDPWILDLGAQNQMIVAYPTSPGTLDPAVCYNTASAELIMNVYETLISFDEEKTDQFVPRLATGWSISPDGLTYTFTIRQGVKFHNDETLTTEDVEYSLERFMVLDIPDGPAWMFYEPLFDVFGSRDDEGHFIVTGQQIDDAITRDATTVTIHLTKPYPPFMQILAQTWSSILCKKWCVEIGDWPGTWNNWTLYNRPYRTAIENQTTVPPGPHLNAMCGTGPYMFDYYQTGVEWSIIKFDNYWGGWPAPGSNGFLQRITAKRMVDWGVRRYMFLQGQLDYVQVPILAVDEVLGQPGIRCIYPLEELSCEAMFFTFNISTSSPYLGVPGGLPEGAFNESGIPSDFFSDINVRKGFAYAFNYTALIEGELRGEAYQPATPIIPGLPFYNPAQEKYSINLDKAMDCFSAAWGGQVWDNGFSFTICYNEGNWIRQAECEIFKANVEVLNSKFHIQVQPIPFSSYLESLYNHEATMFGMGWLADFADPHNFVYAFMYGGGTFTQMQLYSNATVDNLVREGIDTMNETARRQIYYELQSLYYEDCPSVTLYQPIGRRFERDWVQGWYYNPLLVGNYFYVQWKGTIHVSTTYSWPMLHHDLTHAGYSDSPAPNTNQTLWTYPTGNEVFTSPAIADGKVYVGSYDHNVYCLDALTGARIWNYTTGDGIESSPTVVDGRVYIGSNDYNVYCLDALSGVLIWNHSIGWPLYSSPTVAYGRVYVGSIYCLNASTGALLWSNPAGSTMSSPAVVNGRVYAESYNQGVCCLDAFSGVQIWNYTTGDHVVSDSTVVDGKVYVGSRDNKVYCLNALTGEQIWNYTTGGYVFSLAAFAYGKVYVGSYDNKLYCLDALTGARIWNYTTGGYVGSPCVADNKVYVVSLDGKMYCCDASTGALIWSYQTGGGIDIPPAVADGIVFVGSSDHKVYAFGNVVRSEDYPTVQAAINAASPGATVIITPGIYNESIVINKTLTIIGLPGSAPTFNGGGSGIAITLLPGASGSIIAGIVITHWDQGILIIGATNVKIYDNIMSLMNCNGITLEGSNAANNLIYSNIFQDNTVAVNLTASSANDTIYKNIISSNNIGLSLESSGHTIYANIISENQLGIDISNSGNIIYHNNFIDNTVQVYLSIGATNTWDDGYPSGGNYWSVHTSPDLYCGSNTPQNNPGSDGIVDTQYTIAINNIDRYPLLQPFNPHDIGITNIMPSKTITGQGFNLLIDIKVLNYGIYTETFAVTAYANTTVIATQTITLDNRNSCIITFTWNTTVFAKGNYTISAYAWPVQDETDTTDNTCIGNSVQIAKVGDLGSRVGTTNTFGICDGVVTSTDLNLFLQCYRATAPTQWIYLGDLGSRVGTTNKFFICDSQVTSTDLNLLLQCYRGQVP
jgi:peptide/nickel transport system substrate-binding protein